jgi:predicted nicotinamide N-methyase
MYFNFVNQGESNSSLCEIETQRNRNDGERWSPYSNLLTEVLLVEKANELMPKKITLFRRTLGDIDFALAGSDSNPSGPGNDALQRAHRAQSDVVRGDYEGGLKIWESSIDLASYVTSLSNLPKLPRILELGCGAGMPSLALVAYLGGLSQVSRLSLQDYNTEVLKLVTAPNVLVNTMPLKLGNSEDEWEIEICAGDWHQIPQNVDFISGDWSCVDKVLPERQYDIILTAETIYDMETMGDLLTLMESMLAENGIAFVLTDILQFTALF